MAVIGYARVSTAEQNLDLQLTALRLPAQPGRLPTTASAVPRSSALSYPGPWTGWSPATYLPYGSWTAWAATPGTSWTSSRALGSGERVSGR